MKTNSQLQHDVLEELQSEPSADAAAIGVTAKDGIVTLTGTVKSYAEKASAARAAEQVLGVKAVADELEVSLPGTHVRTDEDIAQAVLNAVKCDIMVPDDRIKVMVEAGHVTLEGTVDYQHQKTGALSSIRNFAGVKGITDVITVEPLVTPSGVKAKIESALRRAAELDAERITVEVQNSKVTLRGTVHSQNERTEAERAARSAPGVTQVEDELTVAA